MDSDDNYTIDCTEEEFFELTERLLENDENNCARYIGYDLQDRREGNRDVSEEPLFYDVDDALFEIPTVAKLIALHDNYEAHVHEAEEVTAEEIQEERDFIDACMDTKVMEIARQFMIEKRLISNDLMSFKRFLHKMWFALYPRSRRVLGSCAFEHVFMGELKEGKVNGFHNWIFFLLNERKSSVNYYGFNYCLSFRGKGAVAKTIFAWDGKVKPCSSIFIGLSPELELILYTMCVLMKPNDTCTVSLAGKTVDIQTHVFTNRGKKYLGSAYPDL